jgi:hypothetical protein
VQVSCEPSPEGTDEKQPAQPSLRDSGLFYRDPSVETLGYSRFILRDEGVQILVALGILACEFMQQLAACRGARRRETPPQLPGEDAYATTAHWIESRPAPPQRDFSYLLVYTPIFK